MAAAELLLFARLPLLPQDRARRRALRLARRALGLEEAAFLEGKELAFGDDEVVEDLDAEDLAGLLGVAREFGVQRTLSRPERPERPESARFRLGGCRQT